MPPDVTLLAADYSSNSIYLYVKGSACGFTPEIQDGGFLS
jgi:hypothetical protein